MMNFIGIDVHKNMITVASIDELLNVQFVQNMSIQECISYISVNEVKVIAIDAPLELNKGFMNDEEYRKNLNPKLMGHYNKKVSEYELSRRGINPFATPGDMNEITGWKTWMKTGFELFERLQVLGFKEVHSGGLRSEIDKNIVEVFPHACFSTLLECLPLKKDSDEGIEQRKNILNKLGFNNIEELLKGINKHGKTDKLDAIVAAYTSLMVYNRQATFVGDIKEGQIALPVEELKEKYKRTSNNSDNLEIKITENYNSEKVEVLDCSKFYKYEYLNIDSVIWLKYFRKLEYSPDIKELLDIKNNPQIRIRAKIIDLEVDKSVEVVLEPIRNSVHGLKAVKEFKNVLKEFWGSHGDKKKYNISIAM